MNAIQSSGMNRANRREFLKVSSKAAVGGVLASAVTRPGYTAEDNTIRVALVGCGGRGTGAAANALATRSGPIKLVAMADLFEDRLDRSYEALKSAASRVQGSADTWVTGFEAAQVEVSPEQRFLGFDAYQKAMDCLKRGAEASLVVAMGRKAVHTGQAVTFEEMLNDQHEFAPDADKFTKDSSAPVQPGPDSLYPVPQPGRLEDQEY